MAKKIDRTRIESGKFALPKKLGFLTTEKVDFVSISEQVDGSFNVEVSTAALSKLVKARGELKTIKADNKKAAADAAKVLETEKTAHEETRAALAKAERRIKTLEKKMAGAVEGGQDVGKGKPAEAPKKAAKATKAAVKPAADKIGNGAPAVVANGSAVGLSD